MKVVILAGGLGTRLTEETELRPKPMVEIGGRPILWHIMKIYSHFGFNDFVVCCGYKGYFIKDYFHHYYMHEADMTVDMGKNTIEYHNSKSEPWRVTLVDTGLRTMTGGRLKRVEEYVGKDTFMLTYGDGVADIEIPKLLEFHKTSGKLATLTAVQPSGKFGSLALGSRDIVTSFEEKPKSDGAWVNAGFFVLEPKVFELIRDGDATTWERGPLVELAREGMLAAYKHRAFWRPMDTLRDKLDLEDMWSRGGAPWRVWNE